jgi:hypothetical protein
VPAIYQDGSGAPVPLRGPAMLRVILQGAAAHDEAGSSTMRTAATWTPEYPTLRQVRPAGDFEGVITSGLGLRDRVGFRVFGLANPTRVVVDVAHQPRIPFGTAAFARAGTAADVLATGVRTGAHPGYDRATFDLAGTAKPAVRVSYAASGIDVTLTAAGTAASAPHASFTGTAPAATGLAGIRGISLASAGGGSLKFHLSTGARDGFRVLMLDAPTRIVVDVAH